MGLLAVFAPKLALRRAFPDMAMVWEKTDQEGTPRNFHVRYIRFAGGAFGSREELIGVTTFFGYKKDKSLAEEFELLKGIGIAGAKPLGERSVQLKARDREYAGFMKTDAVHRSNFEGKTGDFAEVKCVLESRSGFLKIMNSSPLSKQELAWSKFEELISELRFDY